MSTTPPPPPPPPPAPAPPPAGVPYRQDHPRAVVALVLGIIGVVTCQIASPFALVLGRNAMKDIDASQGTLGGRGMAQAGFILGIIGTVILGLVIIGLLILIPVSISSSD